MASQNMVPVQLRVVCLRPPPDTFDGQATHFGLQDKKGGLDSGTQRADGARILGCEAQAKLKDGKPDFSGAQVQGKPGERFLYLSWAYAAGGWVQRIKIPLSDITWQQIEQAASSDSALEAVIEDGTAAATVRPKQGWVLVSELHNF